MSTKQDYIQSCKYTFRNSRATNKMIIRTHNHKSGRYPLTDLYHRVLLEHITCPEVVEEVLFAGVEAAGEGAVAAVVT